MSCATVRSLPPTPILAVLSSFGTRSGRVCSVLGVSVDMIRSGPARESRDQHTSFRIWHSLCTSAGDRDDDVSAEGFDELFCGLAKVLRNLK